MDKNIIECTWKKYSVFSSLCCVATMPNPSGKCFCIEPDVAFVGYNYPWRNNGMRIKIWPEHTIKNRAIDLNWLNTSVRTLTRIMVKPEFRKQGIAEYLIKNTVNEVGVQFIECVTFTDAIARILNRIGFVNYGRLSSGVCDYYLYEVKKPVKNAF